MATDDSDSDVGGVRSPRYPSVSLKDAVAKVKSLYDADKTAGSPLEAALKHMGYKNAKSGPATKVIAALKRYGLVEVRSGRAFPTNRAVAILRLSESDQRRQSALRDAVLAPEIYRELVEQYQESGLPSISSLENELVLGGRFNHNAVPGFVNDFIESLKFAGLADQNGVLLGANEGTEAEESSDDDSVDERTTARKRKARTMAAGTKEDVFSLDEGPVVLQWPHRLSKASADDLRDWLELIGRKIARSVDASAPVTEEDGEGD